MTKYNKLQTILMANSISTLFMMMGFHTTMTVGSEDSLHQVEVSVFWDDEKQLRLIRENSRGLLRDGDGYREANHNNTDFRGGWVDFILYFK